MSWECGKMKKNKTWAVEVFYKAGVTDAVGDSVRKGIEDIGIKGVNSVRTAQKYIINGKLDKKDIENICENLLANPVVQTYKIIKNSG